VFDSVPGVTRTVVGYTGGETSYPSYATVCTGDGHTEALRVEWDPSKTTYSAMLNVFRKNYTGGCRSTQYRSAIWFHSPQQKLLAEGLKRDLESSRECGQLDIESAQPWWNAEFYHQKYQSRTMMTLGLWAIMGSFCSVGGMLGLPLKLGVQALRSFK